MVTSWDKAIVSFFMAVLFALAQAGIVVPDWLSEPNVMAFAAFLSPILVYLVPNKSPDV